MLGVIASICQKNQIAYQLEMHHYRSEDPSSLPHQIAANMVDGAILIGDVGQEVYDALEQKRHFPWVSIGEPARYAVMMDICDATDQLLKQVAALGHQRVAYCDGPHRHLEHRLAFETVMRFSRAHGWDRYQLPDWFLSCESQPDLTMKKVTQWTQQLLGQSDPQMRPSLIVCHGNNISRTVAFTATEMGYKIGKDLSVTSWGSMGDARNYRPVMTSVVYDHRAMAQSALDMLMQLMQAPDAVTPQIQLIRSPICLGDSLGPCHHS
jgi:DNA-binding LacI/PurR family transcriptional regulator